MGNCRPIVRWLRSLAIARRSDAPLH
jgi:hypothetical protein